MAAPTLSHLTSCATEGINYQSWGRSGYHNYASECILNTIVVLVFVSNKAKKHLNQILKFHLFLVVDICNLM